MLLPTAAPIATAPPASSGSLADTREAGTDGFALVLAVLETKLAGAAAAVSPEPGLGERGSPAPAFDEHAGRSPGAFLSPARSERGALRAPAPAVWVSRPATVTGGATPFDEGASPRFAGLAGATPVASSSARAAIVGAEPIGDPTPGPAAFRQPDADPGATAAAAASGWQGRSPIGAAVLDPGPVAATEVPDEMPGSTEAGSRAAPDAAGEPGTERGRPALGLARPVAPPDRTDVDGFAAGAAVTSAPGDATAARAEAAPDPSRADDAVVAVGPDASGGKPPSPEVSPVSMATRAMGGAAANLAARGRECESAGPRFRAEADAATAEDIVAIDAGVPRDLAPPVELAAGRPVGEPVAAPRYVPSPSQAPAVQIAAALLQRDGAPVDRLRVALQPPELGGVEVTLTSEGRRKIRALVLVDRPETLELLRREQPTLERILIASGLELEAGGLEFGLRKDGERRGGTFAPSTTAPFTAEPVPRVSEPAPARLLDLRLLDLVV